MLMTKRDSFTEDPTSTCLNRFGGDIMMKLMAMEPSYGNVMVTQLKHGIPELGTNDFAENRYQHTGLIWD